MGVSERLATAILELTTDATQLMRGLGDAGKHIDAAGAKWQAVGKSMQATGQSLTAGITLPLLAIGGGALKLATDFESSFAGILKTVGDATDQFGNLTDTGRLLETGMRDLAKQIPLDVNEFNRIGEAAGQLGIKSENILGFTEVMAALGVTTNLSSDAAATALARLANITQMPQKDFDRLGSTIVALGNNMATTEAEIVEFGLRLAGAGTQVGLSEAQILSIGAALSSVGINAEAGGTAISKVMIDMASSVDGGGDRLRQFAAVARMSAEDFARQFRTDAAGALTAFVAGLGNLEGTGRTALGVLSDMGIEEVRMRDALLRASGAGDLLAQSLQIGTEAWRDNTALTKEAEQRYGTTASQMTLLWNNIKDVGIELGKVLLPILGQAVEALRGFIPYLEQAVEWFKNLSPTTQKVVIAIGALAAAIGPVLVAVGTVTAAIGAAMPVLSAVGGAIVAICTGPIALIVAAVAGLAFVWIKWGDDITRVVSKTWTAIKTWLWDKLGPVLEPIGGLLRSVGGMFQAFHELVYAVLGKVVGAVASMVTGVIGWLRDKLAPVFAPILVVLRSLATVAGEVGAKVVAHVRLIYEGAKTWLLDKFTGIVDGIKTKIDAVAGFFRDLKDKVVGHSYVPDMVNGVGHSVAQLDETLVARTKQQTESVGAAFKGLSEKVKSLMAELAGDPTALTTLGEAWQHLGGVQRDNQAVIDRVADAYVKLRKHLKPGEYPADLEAAYHKSTQFTTALEDMEEKLQKTAQEGMPAIVAGAKETKDGFQLVYDLTEDLVENPLRQLEEFANFYPNTVVKPITQGNITITEGAGAMGREFEETLSKLGGAFQALAQTGGPLSGFAQTVGTVIQTMGLGRQAGTQLKEGLDKGTKGFSQIAAGAVSAIAAMEAATESTNKLTSALSGAATGASMGGGGWGSVFGAVGGFLYGWIKASDNAKASIHDLHLAMEKLFTKYRPGAVAELFKIHGTQELYLDYLYGSLTEVQAAIDALSYAMDNLKARVRDTSVLWSQATLDQINQYRRAGIELEEITVALDTQYAAIATGARGLIDAFTSPWIAAQEEAERLREEIAAATDPKVIARLTAELGLVDDQLIVSQEEFDRYGRIISTAFASAMVNGETFLGALEQFGPQLDNLSRMLAEAGLEADTTLQTLLGWQEFAVQNPTLVSAVDSLNSMMRGLWNTGMLNEQMFADLGMTVVEMFSDMTEHGRGGEQGLRALQPTLQQMWQIWHDTGYVIDEATQRLIEDAEAAGIVGEAYQTEGRRQVKAMEAVEAILGDLAKFFREDFVQAIREAFGATEESARRAGRVIDEEMRRERNIRVRVDLDDWTFPDPRTDPRPPADDWGGIPRTGEGLSGRSLVSMAAGGAGVVTRPTLFLAGEAGPEEFAFSGGGRRFAAAGTDDRLLDAVGGLRRDLMHLLPPMIERAARHGAQTAGRRR